MPALEQHEDIGRRLEPELRARLDAGEHTTVAAELAGDERHAEAGWVLEQIWDFAAACEHYLFADRVVDALRMAVEDGSPAPLARVFEVLEARRELELLKQSAALLERRGRHEDAARVLAWAEAGPEEQAAALAKAGDRLAAAKLLAGAGQPRRALDMLGPLELHGPRPNPHLARDHALAAELCWDLGDAEGTARHAQEARRGGALAGALGGRVRRLLARALSSLGHDLAGQLVLGEGDEDEPERSPTELAPHGRYRVTGVLPAAYAGAAYVGVDRVTLQEVEIHLLLAEYSEQDRPGVAVRRALDRFARATEAANALAHPAIRPILRLDTRDGLLVMPRREGPILRGLIRPPGLAGTRAGEARARSLIAFMLDGVATAHGAGLTHGSLLPSQIVCDPLGRPLLGPFGAHFLAGLVATRTGGLEELLSLTPPEQRAGEAPTQAGDIYMLGALWAALLAGRFAPDLDELPAGERDEIVRWLDADPEARPKARQALARLKTPVEDLSQLAGAGLSSPEDSMRAPVEIDPRLGRAVTVVADESWSEVLLDLLCMARNPWLQNILDRDGRAFRLAAWPRGCKTLAAEADWRAHVDPLALELLTVRSEPNAPEADEGDPEDQALRAAIVARMDGTAVVVTPAGERMLALDRLLDRGPS